MTGPEQTRAVVVFGASSGIGLAVATMLSSDGASLVVCSRAGDRLRDVARTLSGPVEVVAADLTDAAQVEAAVERCVEAYGRVDAVFTSAQPMAYGTVEEVPAAVLDKMSQVAVIGTSHLARAALPRFRQQGGGTLVVVSSLLAQIAVPSMGAYCAAKWGQLGLVRSLQMEVRADAGVEVCLVLPGAIDTPIYHQAGTWAGSLGSAPPPVVSAERVAAACLRLLDRPRRMTQVGPVNRSAVLGYRVAPWLYDRLAPWLVRLVVLRGPASSDHAGNVFEARPDGEAVNGGWTVLGRLRTRRHGPARWRRRGR